MAVVPATTGLDVTEDKLRLDPGTLQNCLNYEMAYRSGYSWLEGMLRFDGRAETEDLSAYRALVQNAPGGPAYGVHHFTDRSTRQSWLYAVVEAQRISLASRPISADLLTVQGQRAEIYETTPTGLPNAWILEADAGFAGETRDLMEVLIDPGVDVFSGNLVTYTRVDITNGQLEPAAGDQITDPVSGWVATVRGIQIISGTAAGSDLVAALWVEIDTAGAVGTNAILERVSDGLTVGLAADVTGYSDNGVLAGTGLSAITDVEENVNRGVLIRSNFDGWETVPTAYEVNFISGQNEPADVYSNGGSISEAETPGALASAPPDAAFWTEQGHIDWDLNNTPLRDAIQDDDASFTVASLAVVGDKTEYIRVRDFGETIDELDEPTGVEIQVICERASGTMDITVDEVLSDSGAKRGVGTVVDAKSTLTFGSPTDMWGAGNAEQLRTNLENPNYKWLVRFAAAGTDAVTEVNVYMIRRIVYLRSGSLESIVYLRAGGTDYQARALYTHVESGSFNGDNAAGVMTLARVETPALVPANAVVYTQPAGAGNVVAILDGSLTPLRLPSRARMTLKQSQFEFIDSNFFAADRLAAVYGVSGADHAFTFNNNYIFKIRTGRTIDEPRHIGRHKERLALGFLNGDADFSVNTQPDLYDGVLGAFTLGFGRNITGMLPLDGETLGVWTETSIWGVQGTNLSDVIQQVIAPETGALEYTVRDIGMPLFLDFRGISTIQSSAAYGDFDNSRLSKAVRPWLLPRLSAGPDSGLRPILAEAVPKKNQYRIWFEDGYVLTMTWLEDRVPRFTWQKYWLDSNEDPLTIVAACNGVDENNEPFLFATFEETPLVMRMHHGSDFDGEPIRGFMTFNPIHANGPGRNVRVNTVHIHGVTEGLVQLDTKIGVDYRIPDENGYTSSTFMGDATQTEQRPAFCKTRHKARGRDFALRIETTTNTMHTVQVIEFPNLSGRKLEP